MKINLRGFEMAYDERGSGIPLLLIHGYPLSRQIWQPQLEGLSDTFRVIAPDLRGFGESQAVPGPYSMDLLAEDCFALLNFLEIAQPSIVCGLSMGGYVAFAFWRKFPQRVRGLALAATRALPDTPETAENRLKAAALAEKEGAEAIARAMLPKMLSPRTLESRPALVAQVKSILLSASVPGIVGALMGMRARPDSSPTLGTITAPTLIVRGSDDGFAPLEEAQVMQAAIHHSRLVVIPEAGHLPNLEQAERFNRAVKESFSEA
jgi:pimeloyl-ACP methyl ester carboxylesterase